MDCLPLHRDNCNVSVGNEFSLNQTGFPWRPGIRSESIVRNIHHDETRTRNQNYVGGLRRTLSEVVA
jgi:hypothetical protein